MCEEWLLEWRQNFIFQKQHIRSWFNVYTKQLTLITQTSIQRTKPETDSSPTFSKESAFHGSYQSFTADFRQPQWPEKLGASQSRLYPVSRNTTLQTTRRGAHKRFCRSRHGAPDLGTKLEQVPDTQYLNSDIVLEREESRSSEERETTEWERKPTTTHRRRNHCC